jgi:hypothetical protein
VALIYSCTYQEPRIGAEPILNFPAHNVLSLTSAHFIPIPILLPQSSKLSVPPTLNFDCAEWNPAMSRFYDSLTSSFTGGSSILNVCIYITIDDSQIATAMNLTRNEPETQDSIIHTLISASDHNCNNFRSRVFAFRSNVSYVGGLASGLFASGGAITALTSGPAAAGLAGASAAISAAINPINTDYYSGYTMALLDTLIKQKRADMEACIDDKMSAAERSTPIPSDDPPTPTPTAIPSPTPAATPAPHANCPTSTTYTAAQKLLDFQACDNLRSLEILSENQTSTPTPTQTPTSTPSAATPTAAVTPSAPDKQHKQRKTGG